MDVGLVVAWFFAVVGLLITWLVLCLVVVGVLERMSVSKAKRVAEVKPKDFDRDELRRYIEARLLWLRLLKDDDEYRQGQVLALRNVLEYLSLQESGGE